MLNSASESALQEANLQQLIEEVVQESRGCAEIFKMDHLLPSWQ